MLRKAFNTIFIVNAAQIIECCAKHLILYRTFSLGSSYIFHVDIPQEDLLCTDIMHVCHFEKMPSTSFLTGLVLGEGTLRALVRGPTVEGAPRPGTTSTLYGLRPEDEKGG